MTLNSRSFFYKISKAKVWYYTANILRQGVPLILYNWALKRRIRISALDNELINKRVNYYNKLNGETDVGPNAITLAKMRIFKSPKAYNFDTYIYTRYFNRFLKANFLFGDVTHVAEVPSIQKSRPVAVDNANAVLLNLDKRRHFVFVKDERPFSEKKDLLIGRGVITQPHRIRFMQLYFNNPLCDLGQVNKTGGNIKWLKPKLDIAAHLQYKFILSLEGNDVATNLKWIMSSNSIAVMPKPKYETWFMEGCLIGGEHYIEIKSDFSDLEERLTYYIQHPDEAALIIVKANAHVKQFLDTKREDVIALLVLHKYFKCTSQIE